MEGNHCDFDRQERHLRVIGRIIIVTMVLGTGLSYVSRTLQTYASASMMVTGVVCLIATLVVSRGEE
jgi:xanthine/uracil permease